MALIGQLVPRPSITIGDQSLTATVSCGSGVNWQWQSVMRSLDGTVWATSTSAANNNWTSVTYGNGLFVAVSASSTTSNVMTSPDGITWTLQTGASSNSWQAVTYGNGLFVAVASTGSGQVMTSTDGVTWTSRTSAADNCGKQSLTATVSLWQWRQLAAVIVS
ncbi:MAG: hypothetical protein R3B53_01955 [Candidatus Paceibacterota bacterium]